MALKSLIDEEEDPAIAAENLNVRIALLRNKPTGDCSKDPTVLTT